LLYHWATPALGGQRTDDRGRRSLSDSIVRMVGEV